MRWLYRGRAGPMAARSKAWVCGGCLAGNAGSNPPGVMSVSCECCVLSGRGLCVGPITRPEESYRVWFVWAWSWGLDNGDSLSHWGCWAMGGNYRTGLMCCNVDCFDLSSVSLREYLTALLRVRGCCWNRQQFKHLCGNAANVRQQWGVLDRAS
jgi:hypothetical protein